VYLSVGGYIHVHTHTHARTHTHTHTCMYMHLHVCVSLCVYTGDSSAGGDAEHGALDTNIRLNVGVLKQSGSQAVRQVAL
jgi:hypothetical protein